jgi:hypothetical protein
MKVGNLSLSIMRAQQLGRPVGFVARLKANVSLKSLKGTLVGNYNK